MASTLQPLPHSSEEPSVVNVIAKVRCSPSGAMRFPHNNAVIQSHTVRREATSDSCHRAQVPPNMWSSRGTNGTRVTVGGSEVVEGALEKQQQPSLRIGVSVDDAEGIRDRMINSSSNSTYMSSDVSHAVSQPPAPISGTEVWTNKPYLGAAVVPHHGELSDRNVIGGSPEAGSCTDCGMTHGARQPTPPQQRGEGTASSISPYARHTRLEGDHKEHARNLRAPSQQQQQQHFYGGNQNHMYNGGQYSREPEREAYDSYYSGQGYGPSSPHHVQQPRYPNRLQQQQQQRQQQQPPPPPPPPSLYYAPQHDPRSWHIGGDARYGQSDHNNCGPPQGKQRYPDSAGGRGGATMQQYNNNAQLSSATTTTTPVTPLPQQQWSAGQGHYSTGNASAIDFAPPPPTPPLPPTPTAQSAHSAALQQAPSPFYPGSGDGNFSRYTSSTPTARVGVTSGVTPSSSASYGVPPYNWRTHPPYSDDSSLQQQHAVPPAYHGNGNASPTPYQSQTASGGVRVEYPEGRNQGQYYYNQQWNYGYSAQQGMTNTTNYHHQPGRQGYNCAPYGSLGGPSGAISTHSIMGNVPSYAPPQPLPASGYAPPQQQQQQQLFEQHPARGLMHHKGGGGGGGKFAGASLVGSAQQQQ